jgi:hypothetical protein
LPPTNCESAVLPAQSRMLGRLRHESRRGAIASVHIDEANPLFCVLPGLQAFVDLGASLLLLIG